MEKPIEIETSCDCIFSVQIASAEADGKPTKSYIGLLIEEKEHDVFIPLNHQQTINFINELTKLAQQLKE